MWVRGREEIQMGIEAGDYRFLYSGSLGMAVAPVVFGTKGTGKTGASHIRPHGGNCVSTVTQTPRGVSAFQRDLKLAVRILKLSSYRVVRRWTYPDLQRHPFEGISRKELSVLFFPPRQLIAHPRFNRRFSHAADSIAVGSI